MKSVEIWGGVECSIRRVGDGYMDQVERSGHRTRLQDLDAIAELGIRKLRYPVLWEHVAPDSLNQLNWGWTDERLSRLQELQIEPIVGLVHHGSGPRYTALHEESFATGLARFARLVAERYPWVEYYTPINEPLTTARFSGLYGLWYPHGTHDSTFVRILLNEVRATKRAMQAIRQVNPAAKLVQTEDLGQTHSTPALAHQAEFENHRRWLSFDLLCGRVQKDHPMWKYLRKSGATVAELLEFSDDPLPPDILGINHYITSERFLDERTEHYPESLAGQAYVDVEAVRVNAVPLAGLKGLAAEAWERYRLPLAVTEAHLACTREEQMRWVHQTWQDANRLREQGVDMQAITIWSLLGAYDWNSLLTCEDGYYESGAFDVRSGQARPTALFKLVQALAREGNYEHPVLQIPGWWNRDTRFLYHHHTHLHH
jgi:beta-glucosidase/6-phospho-beta-glucosidase/beta-galactosidase